MSRTTYHLTAKSSNQKTGPIPVTTTSADTCPDACPLKRGGCYAKLGHLGMHWRKVTARRRGGALSALLDAIRALPEGQLWRHNQAGDLPGKGDAIDSRALARIVNANLGRRGFTYTHKPILGDSSVATSNRASVNYANTHRFVVNLSANSLPHADELLDADCAPVVTLLPADAPPVTYTPAGRKVITCPAQQRDDITCANCQMCARRDRSVVIGFLPHGAEKTAVDAIARLDCPGL